ncbi:MAG: hypothetical protein AAFO97_00845 [Pseudomonadota bacterium]
MLKDHYAIVGEFCLAVGTVETAADEVLFCARSAYGTKIRDLSILPFGSVKPETLKDYPHRFPDKLRLVQSVARELVTTKIDLRSVLPPKVEFIHAVDEVYALRNAVFHGKHVGKDVDGKHVYRRAVSTKKESKKKVFQFLQFHVSNEELVSMSALLLALNNYLCGVFEAIKRDDSEQDCEFVHGSVFWQTLSNVFESQSLDGRGAR